MPDDLDVRPSIIFNHRLPPKCDSLFLDLRLLIDCLLPLMVNAVQNTAGGVVALTTTVSDDCQMLCFDIQDTGRGIDAKDIQRILLPYEKVDAHTTGAGLGLTLSCRVATLMNGSVSLISSEIDKGSHFRATFHEPTCACSFPPSRPIKTDSVQLPYSFRRSPSASSTLSLSHCFIDHLIGQGLTESTNAVSSVVVLDYTPDLIELQKRVLGVGKEEVAVCLVPDSSCLLDFQDRHLLRDGNVIYVKGPFVSKALNQALAQAHSVLAEFATTSFHSAQISDSESKLIEKFPPVHTVDDTHILEHTTPPCGPATASEELAVFVQNLRINATLPVSAVRTIMRSTRPMTLLVDDNAVNLRLLQMYCKRRNIPHCTAVDGQQAVDLVKKHQSLSTPNEDPSSDTSAAVSPFELVLMDLQMPICDGVTATRQIRLLESEHGWSKSAIFIVTGQDSGSDRVDAEDAGADEFLVKPVGPKALDHRIKQWFPDSE
jgi:CheY-like chemotaxis protein